MRILLVAASVVAAQSATAQTAVGAAARAQGPSSVSGRVATPGVNDAPVPVPGVMVTLHRVGTDSSGAVDSVATDAAGRYALTYRRAPGDEAVYFASAVFRGIAYFSNPLQAARVSGEAGEITVFDTTSRAVEFHVQGHHLVVSAPRPDGARDIVEVWELSNDKSVTVVGKDSLSPVWSAPLPAGASNVAGGQGDVAPSAIVAQGDRVSLLAAFGPGVKQVSYAYTLPASAFPLVVPVTERTNVLEVLLEEPTATVTGGGLQPMPTATTAGRSFKRLLAQNVPPGESLRISVPATSASARTRVLAWLAGTIVLVMIVALVIALMRRRVQDAPVVVVAAPLPNESLIAAIAALDARRERGDATLDDATYTSERAALKSRLAQGLGGNAIDNARRAD